MFEVRVLSRHCWVNFYVFGVRNERDRGTNNFLNMHGRPSPHCGSNLGSLSLSLSLSLKEREKEKVKKPYENVAPLVGKICLVWTPEHCGLHPSRSISFVRQRSCILIQPLASHNGIQ